MLISNKKMISKILIVIALLLTLFQTVSSAVVSPTRDFYVNDYANLLSEETKQYIINVNAELQSKTGAQIVVVTIPSLEGQSLEEYANELFRKFGIGDKKKNNGLLLLLALKERQFRVEVGNGLEGILPDGKTGRIQNEYIIPYLKENNWNEGIKNGFDAFLDVIVDEYQVDIDRDEPQEVQTNYSAIWVFLVGILGFIIGLYVRYFYVKKTTTGFKTLARGEERVKKVGRKHKKVLIFSIYPIISIIILLILRIIFLDDLYIILIISNVFGYFLGICDELFFGGSSFGDGFFGGGFFGGGSGGGGGFSGGGGTSSGGGSSSSF